MTARTLGALLAATILFTHGEMAAAVAAPPSSLAQVLDSVAWDSAQRGGALLVVNAEGTRPVEGTKSLPAPPPRTGYRLSAVAPLYGRKAVRIAPALTVLAPETMVLLDSAPPKNPDPLLGMERGQRAKMLFASLTPTQWRRLCGTGGLGPADVTREQLPLYRSLVPQPFQLRQVRTNENGQEVESLSSRFLSEKEWGGVRLRLNWTFGLTMPLAGGTPLFPAGIYSTTNALPPSTRTTVFGAAQGPDPTIRPEDSDPARDSHFGKEVRRELPNRLKTGDLDFAVSAMTRSVRLKNGHTLGEWVRTIGEATGQELHADRRIADLPVQFLGMETSPKGTPATVRTGDLLRALCLAVTGTFRKVEPDDGTPPLYILTHDIEGIAVQKRRVWEWRGALSSQIWSSRDELIRRLRAARAPQYLDFPPAQEESVPISAAIRDAVRRQYEQRMAGGANREIAIPLSALSPEMRRLAEQRIRRLGSGKRPQRVQGDQAKIYASARLSFLVPGEEKAIASFVQLSPNDLVPNGLDDKAPPPTAAPVELPTAPGRAAALLIAPTAPEEIGKQIIEAKRHGFTEVWIDTPETDAEAVALLTAAVKAGKQEGMLLRAAVSLLRTRQKEETVPPAQRDYGLFGETWTQYYGRQWGRSTTVPGRSTTVPERSRQAEIACGDLLRCDLPVVWERLLRHLRAIAAVPGLAGIALRDTAAEGYSVSGRFDNYSTDGLGGWSGGYVPSLRAALIRKVGVDPLDLADFYGGSEFLSLPFFPDRALRPRFRDTAERLPNGFPRAERITARTPRQEWQALRYQADRYLLNKVRNALRAAAPNLPVYLAEQTGEEWYGQWDNAEAVPNAEFTSQGAEQSNTVGAIRTITVDPRFLEPRLTGAPAGKDLPLLYGFLRTVGRDWGLTREEIQALGRSDLEPPLLPLHYLPNVLRRKVERSAVRPGGGAWAGFVFDLSRVPAESEVRSLLDAGVLARSGHP